MVPAFVGRPAGCAVRSRRNDRQAFRRLGSRWRFKKRVVGSMTCVNGGCMWASREASRPRRRPDDAPPSVRPSGRGKQPHGARQLGHIGANLLGPTCADGGLDGFLLLRWWQHGRHAERVDPQLPPPTETRPSGHPPSSDHSCSRVRARAGGRGQPATAGVAALAAQSGYRPAGAVAVDGSPPSGLRSGVGPTLKRPRSPVWSIGDDSFGEKLVLDREGAPAP
jgi:hypothetical protein